MKTKHLLALAMLLCGVTPLLPAQDAAPAAPAAPPTEDRRRIRNTAAPGADEPQPPTKIERREIKTAEMRDIQLGSDGKIWFAVGETKYFFSFPASDSRGAATDFSACVALLTELRMTEKFTVSFQMRTDIPAEKTISFTELTIPVRVHSLVLTPPRVP